MPFFSGPRETPRGGARPRSRSFIFFAGILASAGFALFTISNAHAATYYVDPSSPTASDAGPGTSSIPYRTIQAAVNVRGGAGVTIVVRPATYREAVTVSRSGADGAPFVLKADPPGAIITGADDYSSTSRWAPYSGDVWLASSVTWSPGQVFADGTRLTASTAAPADLGPRTFTFVSGAGLYVHAGGGNPGTHGCQVGKRTKALDVVGWYVEVDGFTFTSTDDRAVAITASHSAIRNCTVTFSHKQGIVADRCTGAEISGNTVADSHDHGIYVLRSTACVVRGNHSYRNARPAARAATGIDVDQSPNTLVEGNRCHDNQDSGIQFYNGSNDGVSRNNLSWSNGDHGFDHVRSPGVRHVHDVAWGNYKDGFSFEGVSPGCSLHNSIAIDNGLGTAEFDVYVDPTSTAGFVSDYNVLWNSTTRSPVKFGSTPYATLAALRTATGLDAHSTQADPVFVQPSTGNFHLRVTSPAIDAAASNVASWPALDADGLERIDDPNAVNTGDGTPVFADRGAHEYYSAVVSGEDRPPVVTAPTAVAAVAGSPLSFTVAAADSDGDSIAALTADLSALPAGNAATFTPNATNTGGTFRWTPGSADARTAPYSVAFTASNALSGSAATTIAVNGSAITGGNLCGNSGFETTSSGWRPINASLSRVSGGRSGSYSLEMRASGAGVFGVGDEPSWVIDTPAAGRTYRFGVWVRSSTSRGAVRIRIREFLGTTQQGTTVLSAPVTLSTSWQPVAAEAISRAAHSRFAFDIEDTPAASDERFQIDDVAIVVPAGIVQDRAPVVTAPATAAVSENARLTVTVAAADSDGDAIATLTANLANLPPGNDAVFTFNAARTSGTLTWTPTANDGGAAPYVVTFTAGNGMSGSATTAITVTDVPGGGNLVANSGFESSLAGWAPLGMSTLTRVEGGHGGTSCVQAVAPAATTFGITDSPNLVPVVAAPGLLYRVSAWVRSPSSAGNAKIKVREFAGGLQQGGSAYSSALPLTPAWQPITFDYVTRTAGSFLDIEINDYPVASGETIQIDDVSLVLIGAAPARTIATAALGGDIGTPFSARWIAATGSRTATLRLSIGTAGAVDVALFDVEGRRIGGAARVLDAGTHDLPQPLGAARPGAYFYRVRAPEGVRTGRFVLLE